MSSELDWSDENYDLGGEVSKGRNAGLPRL